MGVNDGSFFAGDSKMELIRPNLKQQHIAGFNRVIASNETKILSPLGKSINIPHSQLIIDR